MATTVTIAGVDVDYQDFKIDIPLSPLGLAPTAEIELPTRRDSVSPGDPVTITIDGSTAFDGTANTSGRIREDGRRTVRCDHDGVDLFEELVTFTSTGGTDQDVLTDALTASSRGASFTLNFAGSTTGLANDYEAEDKSVKRVFRDMMDRGRNAWWVDPATNTINVAPLGNRGQWKALDAQADRVDVRQFDPGSIDSVRNVVSVVGTGSQAVRAKVFDSTSIGTYGEQPAEKPYNYDYATDPLEVDELADALIIPDPLAAGEIIVNRSVGDVVAPLPNYTVALDDASKGISETGLVVEKQTIRQGRATLQIGEGAGIHFDNVNRKAKSGDDNSRPGSVYDSDRIADNAVGTLKLADGSVLEDKLADAAVATAKLQNNAVINGKLSDLSVSETKIQDDSISTPKLVTEAVTANEIEADTITAAEIAAGTITALEIAADTITASQIAADTLTANEIDTLSLDTNQLDIGESTAFYKFNTETGISGEDAIVLEPDGTDGLGFIGNPFGSQKVSIYSSEISSMHALEPNGGDNTGSIGTSGAGYADIYAYNFVDSSTGTAINDGGDPLEGLADGHGPPEHAERTDDETGETVGYSLNEMARSVWDVVRAQQRVISDLEERIEALESSM